MKTDWIGLRIYHPSISNQVFERIEWLKENNIVFITRAVKGLTLSNEIKTEHYLEEEMNKTIQFPNDGKSIKTSSKMYDINGQLYKPAIPPHRITAINNEYYEINLSLFAPAEIGTAFFFNNEKDLLYFKMVWGND